MRRKALIIILAAAALFAVLAVGCDRYEPESTDDGAFEYYEGKYGTGATVVDEHGLGGYALFGYTYHGMEYMMSDGFSVVYLDGGGRFYDNRQSEELQRLVSDFTVQRIEAIPGALTEPTVRSAGEYVGYETLEGEGTFWHVRYDGDIESFLLEEHPQVYLESHYTRPASSEGSFSYAMAYDSAQAEGLEEAYLDIARYVNIGGTTLAVVDRDAFGDGELSLFDEGLRYTVDIKVNDDGEAEAPRYKPVFITLADGIRVSSGTAGIELAEGDVSFEPLGDGFYRCHVGGEAGRNSGKMSYVIFNDSSDDILHLLGIDRLQKVCPAGQHNEYCNLYDGETYFVGDKDIVCPRVEIESATPDKVIARYRTHFKDQVEKVSLRVIGMAEVDGPYYQSCLFDSRIVEELEDGWRIEVDVRDHAKPDNTFAFQLTFNGEEETSVQVEQEVSIPEY